MLALRCALCWNHLWKRSSTFKLFQQIGALLIAAPKNKLKKKKNPATQWWFLANLIPQLVQHNASWRITLHFLVVCGLMVLLSTFGSIAESTSVLISKCLLTWLLFSKPCFWNQFKDFLFFWTYFFFLKSHLNVGKTIVGKSCRQKSPNAY